MMYYYLPIRAGRPIFSYRLSIIGFWGITFFYMWAGSHHLHYTALPHWVQTLGVTFSVMLLVPSWAAAANALLTLNGAWHKVRDDATLRFMMVAAVFYRSEEHTSELQSLMRMSYAVFCLKTTHKTKIQNDTI